MFASFVEKAMKTPDFKLETLRDDFPSSDGLKVHSNDLTLLGENSRGRIKFLDALKCVSPLCALSKKKHSYDDEKNLVRGNTSTVHDVPQTNLQTGEYSYEKQKMEGTNTNSKNLSFAPATLLDKKNSLDVSLQSSNNNETTDFSSSTVARLLRGDKMITNATETESKGRCPSLGLPSSMSTSKEFFPRLRPECHQEISSEELDFVNDQSLQHFKSVQDKLHQDSTSALPVNYLMERINELADFSNKADEAAMSQKSNTFQKSTNPINLLSTPVSLADSKTSVSTDYPFFWRSHPKISASQKEDSLSTKEISPTSVIPQNAQQATDGSAKSMDYELRTNADKKDPYLDENLQAIEEEFYFPPVPERATSYCNSDEAWSSPTCSRWSSPGRSSWANMPSVTEETAFDVTAKLVRGTIERFEI